MIDPGRVFPDLRARTVDEALFEMARGLAAHGVIEDPADLAERLVRRERDACTGVGQGIALPHCRVSSVHDVVLSLGVSASGIDFGAADGIPVTLLFLLLSPKEAPGAHLEALARITRLVRAPGLPDRLRRAPSREAIAQLLWEADAPALTAAPA